MRGVTRGAAAVAAVGLGTLLYANQVELKAFTLRHLRLPLLPGSVHPQNGRLRLLHISDLHYVPGQRRKHDWVQALAQYQPDLVINTGDNLSHQRAVPEVLHALGPLLELPGAFVPGSNDYYAPRWKNPLRYFAQPSELHPKAESLPTEELLAAFDAAGWANLANAHTTAEINGVRLALSGVDDPHIGRDEFAGWPTEQADLRIGLAHAPLDRVLTQFAETGADLILAGHTHGGQVCLPSFTGQGGRALVTNCDLPTDRAKGLHHYDAVPGRRVPVHVSAGLGTSAKAPVRLFCPPEATLIDLVPESA